MNWHHLLCLHISFILLFPYYSHVAGAGSDSDSDSDVGLGLGYKVTLAIPPAYSPGFIGRAFLMEADDQQILKPSFRTALTVQAQQQQLENNDGYSCSLDLFLGNVKVWSSAHFSRFYTTDKCSLELTQFGDLELKGHDDRVGWRSGTTGQDVQRLHLLRSGNLVLVDSHNSIKWQTFNFPTDMMLLGQRLSSRTRLTSFTTTTNDNSNKSNTLFYTFEVQYDKIALCLNFGKLKYSYWEFRPPPGEHNITYVELTSTALEIYNGNFQKVAEISTSSSQQPQNGLGEPLRFLALENVTGNLGLYYYSSKESGFQASYQALNSTCDLPLACDPYGICTLSQTCSCISLVTRTAVEPDRAASSSCNNVIGKAKEWVRNDNQSSNGGSCVVGFSLDNTGAGNVPCESSNIESVEMVELRGVTSVLRGVLVEENGSKERCEKWCRENCTCVAALYTTTSSQGGEAIGCFLYGVVRGIKQVDLRLMMGGSSIYMIKVPKEETGSQRVKPKNSGLKRWVAILIGVGDGLLILAVAGGSAYYFLYKRSRNNTSQDTARNN